MVSLLPLLSLYFLLDCPAFWAETTTATVPGTVKHSSGAVLIGADVTLRNLETGFTRQVTTDQPFNPDDPVTFPLVSYTHLEDVNLAFTSNGYSGFAQDSWHVSRNLTFTLGLRYFCSQRLE